MLFLDLKREKLEKLSKKTSEEEYASVEDVENSLEKSGVPWTICTGHLSCLSV